MEEEKAWVHNWLDAINLNERINGGRTVGHVTDSDNGLQYNGGNFSDSSDSSLNENDREYDDYLYQMAGDFRRRTCNSDSHLLRPSKVKVNKMRPDWFVDRGFQYHGRVCALSLPGVLIALLLGGEMLMFMVCVAGLVIFLLQTSGYHESALTVYAISCVFVTAFNCLTAFPLAWSSVYHFVLVLALTVHTALTGSWMLLLFPKYRRENANVAVDIEYLLFSVYPAVSIILVVWLSAMTSSVFVSSYIAIACSYAVAQHFLQPTQSSFIKPQKESKEHAYILSTSKCMVLSGLYSLLPGLIFLVALLYKRQMIISAWVEFIFVTSICGLLCVVTISEYLSLLYGDRCILLYQVTADTLCFITLPWTVQLFLSGGVDVRMLFLLVYICLLLNVECVFAYMLFDPVEFGVCLFIQTVVFSSTEKILEYSGFLSSVSCISVSVIAVYVIYRLCVSGKLPVRPACVCASFHSTSALVSVTGIFSANQGAPFWDYVSLLALISVLTSSMAVKDHKPSATQVLKKAACIGILISLNVPLWIRHILVIILRHEPTYIEYFGCVMLLEALFLLHLSSHHRLRRLRQFALLLLLLAAGLAFVQPSLALSWENMVRWMVVSSVVLVVVLTQITKYLKKSMMLCAIFSAIIGLPLGISLSSLVFPAGALLQEALLSVLSTALTLLSILVWLQRTDLEQTACKCMAVVLLELVACSCIQLRDGDTQEVCALTSLMWMLAATYIALILKLHSLRRESLKLTKEGDLQVSRLPLIGNICTMAAFSISFYYSPLSYWNWGFVASLLLFLLQEDHVVLRCPLRENNVVPPLCVMLSFLVLATAHHSSVWTERDWSLTLSGGLEISVTLVTFPVFIVLCTILWSDTFYLSDYYIVFVTPLFGILLLTGSSVYAYCLSVVGLATGYWLLTEKLPLLR